MVLSLRTNGAEINTTKKDGKEFLSEPNNSL